MKLMLTLVVVALQAAAVRAYAGRRRSGPGPSPGPGPRPPWPPSPSPGPPPNTTVTVYHLFEPKYTGLANKDAGDFLGDMGFIFMTFSKFEVDNPEADIQDNIIEMSTVTVKEWGREYLKCNAPGATYNGSHGQALNCPKDSPDYCCTGNRTEITAETPAAYEDRSRKGGGLWFSFPKASQGQLWTEKMERRIQGSCVAKLWREEAGGCSSCGADLDQCVANCIENALCPRESHSYARNYTNLRPSWDRAFSNKNLCPDVPLPKASAIVV